MSYLLPEDIKISKPAKEDYCNCFNCGELVIEDNMDFVLHEHEQVLICKNCFDNLPTCLWCTERIFNSDSATTINGEKVHSDCI